MKFVVFPAILLALTIVVVSQDRFPNAPGKAELLRVCGNCHDADVVFAHAQTAGGWSDTLEKMAQLGAMATDKEWELIEQYLHSQLALIPVNVATVPELQRTMEIPETTARAIVKYRGDNGRFKSIDDLKKVPGLDASTVDSRKDRLVY